jgi:methyl-accepting chemotaxis protein
MNWFKNLKITKKIMSGFILIASISGAIGAFSVYEIHRISDETETMYTRKPTL